MKLGGVGTLVLALLFLGCGRAAARDTDASPAASVHDKWQLPIEVFSWWKRGGDGAALSGLFAAHQKRHPGDVVIHASSDFSGLARKTLRTRMLAGEPPDTFQANAGTDLLQWVKIDGVDNRETKLVALNEELPIVAELSRVVPAILLEGISFDRKIYAIPSNVHRLNSVFCNKSVFAKYGLKEPRTVDDLFRIGETLRGTDVVPIALGSRESWTLALLVFESLLVAREGIAYYTDYFTGKSYDLDPRMLKTLEQSLQLAALVNKNHADISWMQALEMTINGQAAMTVIGDWASIVYAERNLKPGVDFVEVPFPGTENSMVFTSDTFALPMRAKNRVGAGRVLSTMASLEGQRAMHQGKGTLPARTDVPLPDADPTLRAKAAVVRSGALGLALSGLVPPQFHGDIATALLEAWQERDLEPLIHTLKSRYQLLKP